jgi:hypothetical protein
VPAVVNIKTLEERFLEECCCPVAVKYMLETHCWTKKLNKEDYGVDKCWVLLAVVKECTLLKNNQHK